MALAYTWKLTGLVKSNPPSLNVSNVIIGTRWEVVGTDTDGNEGKFSGATPFNLSTVDPNNFTPYDQLTEEQVLGWIKSVVSGSASTNYWAHISEKIEEQIDKNSNQISEVSGGDLPWAPTSGSVTPAP
jgi:hypothetical protein